MKKIVIVGGGISGLSAAFYLQEAVRGHFCNSRSVPISCPPLEITLIEASHRLGGIIQTERRGGFVVENGPDMFLTEKPVVRELSRKLGIEHELIETREEFRKSFVYSGGKLHPIPNGFYLIAPSRISALFDLSFMSFWGKLRMGLEYFIPPKRQKGDRHNEAESCLSPFLKQSQTDDESVASFMTRRFGREAHEKIGQPMFGGIYTADPDKLSLKATMPRFLEMESQEGSVIKALAKRKGMIQADEASGPRYGLFASFKDGMQTLTDALQKSLTDVQIHLETPVTKIERGANWRIYAQNHQQFEADGLCLALPSFRTAELLEEISPELSKELYAIPYESAATANVAYSRASLRSNLWSDGIPQGFGFVVPAVEKRKLIGCTFSSMKFAGRAPEDSVLLRAFLGGAFQRELVSLSDAEISKIVKQEFRDILGIENEPLFISIKRCINSMPQYHVGHLDRVKRVEELAKAISNFSFTSNALHGVGIPDSIGQARKMVNGIIKDFTQHFSEAAL